MKKNGFIYCIVFLVIVLLTMPMSAFLTSKVMGLETARSIWCDAYIFFKDQGSLIGGVLAFIGVIFVINSQWKSTIAVIDDATKRTELNRFQKDKEKALELGFLLKNKLQARRQLGLILSRGENIITVENFSRGYFKDIAHDLHYLEVYLERCKSPKLLIDIISASQSFFRLVEEALYYRDHGDESVIQVYELQLIMYLTDFPLLKDIDKPRSLPIGYFMSVKAGGENYSLQDIRDMLSNNSSSKYHENLLFSLSVFFIWLRTVFSLGFSDVVKRLEFDSKS